MNSERNLGNSLAGITILEIGDQLGDYAAMLLAGLGAEVIKLEPREGSPSRQIGPFASPTPDRGAEHFFWRYNLNKKSAVLDVDRCGSRGRARRARLESRHRVALR